MSKRIKSRKKSKRKRQKKKNKGHLLSVVHGSWLKIPVACCLSLDERSMALAESGLHLVTLGTWNTATGPDMRTK